MAVKVRLRIVVSRDKDQRVKLKLFTPRLLALVVLMCQIYSLDWFPVKDTGISGVIFEAIFTRLLVLSLFTRDGCLIALLFNKV